MSTPSQPDQTPDTPSGAKMDRRTAIKASLTTAAAAGATFQPQVLGFVEPRKNLSGDGNGIFAFTPSQVIDCGGLQLSGRGFGLDLANICLTGENPIVHTTPVFLEDQHLLARVNIGQFSASTRVLLWHGQGGFATPTSLPNNLSPHDRFWSWRSSGTAPMVAGNRVTYQVQNNLRPGELVFRGAVDQGRIFTFFTLPLNDQCCYYLPAGSYISFHFYAQASNNSDAMACRGGFFNDIELDAVTLASAVLNVLKATAASISGIELLTTVDASTGANRVRAWVNQADFSFFNGSLDVRINTLGETEPCGSIDSLPPNSFSVPSNSFAKMGASSSVNSGSFSSCNPSLPVGQCPSIDAQFPDFLFN